MFISCMPRLLPKLRLCCKVLSTVACECTGWTFRLVQIRPMVNEVITGGITLVHATSKQRKCCKQARQGLFSLTPLLQRYRCAPSAALGNP
jgi:hypothetical protein